MVLALIYSAHPIRAKRNGWVGNGLVAIAYEGLPWLAGNLAFGPLTVPSVIVALLYSFGAHGIMTINDFKSMDGDRVSGIKTIPVLHGAWGAAWLAVLVMACGGEWLDLTAEYSHAAIQPDAAHWHDIWNTMFWPTVRWGKRPWPWMA